MEDATDILWKGAKAAHAVLLCEMERGSLGRMKKESIRCGRHMPKTCHKKANMGEGRYQETMVLQKFSNKFLLISQGSQSNRHIHKHICAFWMTQDKQLGHSEKNCKIKQKNSTRDARTPQPGEIFFNTMRYRSSVTVQSSRYFQSNVSYIKVQIMLK